MLLKADAKKKSLAVLRGVSAYRCERSYLSRDVFKFRNNSICGSVPNISSRGLCGFETALFIVRQGRDRELDDGERKMLR